MLFSSFSPCHPSSSTPFFFSSDQHVSSGGSRTMHWDHAGSAAPSHEENRPQRRDPVAGAVLVKDLGWYHCKCLNKAEKACVCPMEPRSFTETKEGMRWIGEIQTVVTRHDFTYRPSSCLTAMAFFHSTSCISKGQQHKSNLKIYLSLKPKSSCFINNKRSERRKNCRTELPECAKWLVCYIFNAILQKFF